jgi:hypothetical protein
MQPCLFCGGDASEPHHRQRCDGRQGAREAAIFDADPIGRHRLEVTDADLPMLMSGLAPATYATSAEAAGAVLDSKDTQRAAVFDVIRAAGAQGRTDDEVQTVLGIDGSSERPRRWELWKQDRIRILCDAQGTAVRRLTRTHRRAVVWIACE